MSDGTASPSLRPTIPSWAMMGDARHEHVVRVAELVDGWAHAMGVTGSERNRWLRAVWLHDALRDAPESVLQEWASSTPGPVELKHGPAAAARAKADGELDRGVLDAVRYHSVGLAEWDMVGRVLYCADYLEPGRDFDRDGRAALAGRFPQDVSGVLRDVARARMLHLVHSGWAIPEPTCRFWNSLVASRGAS